MGMWRDAVCLHVDGWDVKIAVDYVDVDGWSVESKSRVYVRIVRTHACVILIDLVMMGLRCSLECYKRVLLHFSFFQMQFCLWGNNVRKGNAPCF